MFKKLIGITGTPAETFRDILLNDKFDQSQAEKYLKRVNINFKFENSDSFLDICLRNNKFKAASWLVTKGIDITQRNKDNITSVRLAIEKGDIQVVNTMLEIGRFNINQIDQNGRSLLQDAVIMGHNKVAKKLIEHDINVNISDKKNRNVAFDAVAYGEAEVIDTVLNVEDLELNNVDSDGKTLLHQQNILDNDNLAVKLLEKGADPTICDPEGYNFITRTALRGDEGKDVLDAAIKTGCDLNSKVADESTVLMEVLFAFSRVSDQEKHRRSELKDVAKKLIEEGCDIDAIDKDGETVLFDMVRKGDIEGTVFVLEHKVDVNQKNNAHDTPLAIAVLKGIRNMDLILLLLQYGADPTIKNKHNQTIPEVLNEVILHVHNHKKISHKEYLAEIDENGKYMLILKEIISLKGFDFSYYDYMGNPLFFYSFINGDTKTAKLYLQHGMDINRKNIHGHNLFYEYVLKCFQDDKYFPEFRDNLLYLLFNKADSKATNKHGQSIYTKVALIPNCNLKLFRKLIEVTRHDYTSIDNLGRTIIHSCVWSNNVELLGLVYGVQRNIQNIPDNFNILPITYAAILGKSEMVNEFLRRDAIICSGLPISKETKKKFQPTLLKNLRKLKEDEDDKSMLRKIDILIEQTLKDFS